MRKLIELVQPVIVKCDNPECDYSVPNETGDPNRDSSMYLNVPCPKCGENLLTEKDHDTYVKFMKFVNWINKWLSWLMIFQSPHNKDNKVTMGTVHIHDGIKIETKD